MGATLGRIVSDYRGVVEICQQRAIELEISRLAIDRLAGFTEGYSAKILGSGDGKRPKRMWPIALESIFGVLGLKILLIEDEAAAARTLALRSPVVSSHQRHGNRSRLKASGGVVPEQIELTSAKPAYAAHAPVSPAPPVVSRAHLRIVQTRRGSRF
jgi:hypothetical protein